MENEELERPADDLEAGLEAYFTRRYGSIPAPASVWTRLAPQLAEPRLELSLAANRNFWQSVGFVGKALPAVTIPTPRRFSYGRLALVAGLLVAIAAALVLGFSANQSRPEQTALSGVPLAATQTKTPHHNVPGPQEICEGLSDVTSSLNCAYTALGLNLVEIKLSSQVDESQTVGGFTQAVHLIYADSNIIAVGYTVTDTTHSSFEFEDTLTDAEGHPLAYRGGMRGPTINNSFGVVDTFEPPANGNYGDYVSLKLQSRRIAAAGSQVQLNPAAPKPFQFNLRVAYSPVKVLNLHQTVTSAGGKTATLEKAVLTPVLNRFYLRGVDNSYSCELTLPEFPNAGPKETFKVTALWWNPDNQIKQVDGMYIYDLNNFWSPSIPAYTLSGKWRLVVKSGPLPPAEGTSTAANSQVNQDKWVFNFDVP